MTRLELRYQSMMKELLGRSDKLRDSGVKEILTLLDDARKNIISDLQGAVDGSWDAYHLPRLKAATERAVGQWADKYNLSLGNMESGVWEFGREFIDSPLDAMGGAAQAPELNIAALEILKGYSADRIKNLSADLAAKINGQIQLGILGQKNPYEIMREIGRNLTSPGPFKSIAHRAETITRTELARVQNMASSKRLEQMGDSVPGLMHRWLWSGNPNGRIEHQIAHGQVRKVGVAFDVGGEKLMYPGDPAGSPGNVINCGCVETAYMPGWPDLAELKKAA